MLHIMCVTNHRHELEDSSHFTCSATCQGWSSRQRVGNKSMPQTWAAEWMLRPFTSGPFRLEAELGQLGRIGPQHFEFSRTLLLQLRQGLRYFQKQLDLLPA